MVSNRYMAHRGRTGISKGSITLSNAYWRSALIALCLLLWADLAQAAPSVSLVIENPLDGNGDISVVNGGKVQVTYEVVDDPDKLLHKNDRIELLRVADDSRVASVKRGKKKMGKKSLKVKHSENEQLYVRYVRKGAAGDEIATVSRPDDPDFVRLQSVPSASLSDLTIRANAVEVAGIPQPDRLLMVSPSGTEFTSIQAALDSIDDAAADNRYLVKVWPGIYSEQVVMKEHVDIEGSGQLNTVITAAAETTLVGASNAELRHLSVENTGGEEISNGISNSSVASMSLIDVTVNAVGGTLENRGIASSGSSSTVMRHVTVTATGDAGSSATGLYIADSSAPVLNEVIASGIGSAVSNRGIHLPATATVIIRGGHFVGSDNSLLNDQGITRVIDAQLEGPVSNINAGTLSCFQAYDEVFVILSGSCQ